ncbi:MAG: hypothetical protein M3Y56_12335 [Armatimonadota bacterium]|nr:hypothetical protein [Armatimonadota bacterium]
MILIKKSETDVISTDYHRALHSVYRVWVATPQGEAARLVEYEMDQEALEEFVEDYTRFAEIIVRMEVIEVTVEGQGAVVNE